MKVLTACLGTETNTFSPMPTGHANFAETCLVRGGEYGTSPFLFAAPLVVFREKAEQRGWEVAESLCAFAQPAGVTVRSVYEALRDEILDDLRAAMPVDVVLLSLHGAMVAHGYDDCEGDLLARIRAVVGPDVPIGAELDLHCHLTQQMMDSASALVTFKEYPHVDFAERASDLFDIIADAAEGKTKPRMSAFDCRMVGVYYTSAEPMKSYVARLKELEGRDGVLAVSVVHGFPWADVPAMGAQILLVTDGHRGDRLAEELGREFFGQREAMRPNYVSIDEGLSRASACQAGPVVLADLSDNPGGGAPGDSTFILRAMLDRRIGNAALACIWDPVAAGMAMDAGVGARLDLRIGGKIGSISGDPVDLSVKVTGLRANATDSFGPEGVQTAVPMGNAVAVRAGGIDIVLNSTRTQTFSPDAFRAVDIDAANKQILVVKSAQHFYAAFAPLASEILYVAAPGAITPDFANLPYERIDRRKWPLVADPHGEAET